MRASAQEVPRAKLSPNVQGSLAMVFSMAAFAVEDMCLKAAMAKVPIGEALLIMGPAGMAVFIAFTVANAESVLHPELFRKPLIVRSICEVGGRLFYTPAIVLTSLSSATAILQATPLMVALGAVVFFGEKVDWRRWLAILTGFAGVVLILRPGTDAFNAYSLLAVMGMLGFAGRDLATRASPANMSHRQLGIYGFAMLTIAGAVMTLWTANLVWPQARELGLIAMATLLGVAAYYALTIAMRTGELSFVAPFRYFRLVFALLIGFFVFSEKPDAAMLTGSALIVASGVYTAMQSRIARMRLKLKS